MNIKAKLKRVLAALVICCLPGAAAVPASALTSRLPPPPEDTDAFSFLYFGDIQVARSAEYDFGEWGKLAESAAARAPGAAFALQGGDIVESGIDRAQWDAFILNADAALGDMPFFPTNGNHESNFLSGKPELYLEVFDLPENGPEGFPEEFYSFDYGEAHITVLNSWVFSGEQKLTEEDFERVDAWVARDLADSGAVWKIVVTHIPIYAVHKDGTSDAVRERWAPIFEKYGVSLILTGHQHVYSRLAPLTGGAPDYVDGVTQIMGNSGLKFYSSADETFAERTIYNTAVYQLLSIDGDALTVQTFDIGGNELDFAELAPREAAPLTRGEFVSEYFPGGVLLGYGDGEMGLGDAITNEQVITLLRRGAGGEDSAGSPPGERPEGVSDWAADAWAWALETGLIDGGLSPRGVPPRTFILEMLNNYEGL
jgi:hypothetical protein